MALIRSQTFTKGQEEFQIDLDFKDELLMEEQLAVSVIGKRRGIGDNVWQKVELTLSLDMVQGCVVLSNEEGAIGRIGFNADIPSDMDPDCDSEAINANFEGFGDYQGLNLEDAILAIPAVDPVFGCLLKAGVSATAGELIRCERSHRDIQELRDKLKAILFCMVDGSMSILWVATVRAFKCLIMLGFV